MDKIKVAVLNPTAISEAEKMMVCAARLTQRGHTVKDLSDFLALYDKGYTEKTAKVMTQLPHPTIQKFAVINAVIVGASRRFLAQITRHQNEVKFMSASLQYSDYSNEADFVVPYELLDSQMRFSYLSQCQDATSALFPVFCSGRFFLLLLDLYIDSGDNERLRIRVHVKEDIRRPLELVETVIDVVRLRVVSEY